jgi:hypothetical protein
MQQDVVDLRDFYNRPLGGVVRRLLTSRIRSRWRSVQGSQLMGLGFAAPYIGMFRGEASKSLGGRRHPLRVMADEELDPDLLLKLGERGRNRRLGNAESLGGPYDRSLVMDG